MLTPNQLVNLARISLATLSILIAITATANPQTTAILSYFATISLFVACPRIRAGDLASSALAAVVLLCFGEAMQTGILSATRFALTVAAVGAAVLPFKMSRVRRLAGVNGYRSLSDYETYDRRRGNSAAPVAPAPKAVRSPLLIASERY